MSRINIFETINRYTQAAPVNVEGLVSELGLVLRYADLPDDISGKIEKTGSGYTVTVNSNHSETRQRFTIAHEIGHYVYHRDKIGDGIEDSCLYRNTGAFHNNRIGALQESQANQFAASLLMPQNLIDRLRDAWGITSPDEMARILGVSLQALCIRLGMPYPPMESTIPAPG